MISFRFTNKCTYLAGETLTRHSYICGLGKNSSSFQTSSYVVQDLFFYIWSSTVKVKKQKKLERCSILASHIKWHINEQKLESYFLGDFGIFCSVPGNWTHYLMLAKLMPCHWVVPLAQNSNFKKHILTRNISNGREPSQTHCLHQGQVDKCVLVYDSDHNAGSTSHNVSNN